MNTNRRKFRVTFALTAVILAAILFFLVSVLDNLRGARVDMTSDQLFTLSDSAVQILEGLKVPVQVKLYITPSEKMPTQLRNLERDVTEQLRNFEQVSDGMLQFSVFNPQDDEEMQKSLGAKGIQPFQVQSIEKDEMGIKLVWSALTIAYKDKPEEVINQVLPQNLAGLEQDIIGPVYRLTRDRTPRVAVFGPKKQVDQQMAMAYLQQGMQPPEPQDQFTRISELLKQGHYEAVPVELTEASPIPDDVDALIVMALAPLNERQTWEINRALRGGLPVVLAVQAHEYGYAPAQRGGWQVNGQSVDSQVDEMLAGFGVDLGTDHFLDMSMETIDLPREVNLGGMRMQTREPVRLPIQIRVTEGQMFQDSPLVNRIGSLFFLWGTPLINNPDVLASNGLQATNLIESSPNSWTETWSEGPVPGAALDPNQKQMIGPQPLAVLLEGTFPDLWSGRAVPEWPATAAPEDSGSDAPQAPPADVDPAPSKMFVIGSAKMFDDNILAAHQNALLVLNAVDYLAGSTELLSIRSKTLTQRVIRPTQDGEKLAWRIFVVLLVPVLIAIYGIVRASVRRKNAATYRQELTRRGHGA